jgi:hypothetical protein
MKKKLTFQTGQIVIGKAMYDLGKIMIPFLSGKTEPLITGWIG